MKVYVVWTELYHIAGIWLNEKSAKQFAEVWAPPLEVTEHEINCE